MRKSPSTSTGMAGPSRTLALLGLCLQVLSSLICSTNAACAGVASFFGDADLAEKFAQMIPNQYSLKQSDFPVTRPPPPTANGWEMCDWSCLDSYSVKSGERGQISGVYEIEAQFKPIPDVNSTMMVWLFKNLHRDLVYSVNGQKYPMYLVFHGVDHLHHEAYPADNVAVGSSFVWCEVPLTGCQYNRDSATQPWTCPTKRSGFLSSDPESKWSTQMHTKVNMTITRFDQYGIEFIAEETNPFFGGDKKRTVVTTRHTWTDSKKGLKLRTQQWIGLMQAGSDTDYDNSLIAPVTNIIIKERYLDHAVNIPKGNITAAAYMAVLHYTQEYGTLHKWLPQVYNSRLDHSNRRRV